MDLGTQWAHRDGDCLNKEPHLQPWTLCSTTSTSEFLVYFLVTLECVPKVQVIKGGDLSSNIGASCGILNKVSGSLLPYPAGKSFGCWNKGLASCSLPLPSTVAYTAAGYLEPLPSLPCLRAPSFSLPLPLRESSKSTSAPASPRALSWAVQGANRLPFHVCPLLSGPPSSSVCGLAASNRCGL